MVTDEEIRQQGLNTEEELANIHLNHSLLLCEGTTCKEPQHVSATNRMYSDIVDALIESSKYLFKKSKLFQEMPGWNDYYKAVHS